MKEPKPAIGSRPFHPGTPWGLFRFDAEEETPQGAQPPEQPTRPEWLPENFKDEQALVQSYKEAERKLHEQATLLKERETQLEQWQEFYAQQNQQPSADPREKLYEILEDPDRHAELVLSMAQKQADLERRLEEFQKRGPDPTQTELTAHYVDTQMRGKFADWDVYQGKIAEVVQQNPGILGISDQTSPAQAAKNVEAVYWYVKGQELSTPEGQAAAQAAAQQAAIKQAATTMSGAGVRPATQSDDDAYWERVKAATTGGYGS